MRKVIKGWEDVSLKDYEQILIESEDVGMVNAFIEFYGGDKRMDLEEKLNYKWVLVSPKPGKIHKKNIVIGEMELLNLKRMTLGEFIDVESNMLRGEAGFKKAVATLLRKKKIDEWGNEVFEGRDYSIEDRIKGIGGIRVTDYYGIVELIANYVNSVTSGFSIFENDPEDDEHEVEDDEHERLNKAFKWSKFTFFTAGGDILRMEDALKTNHLLIFGTLTMQKKLNIKPKANI